MTHKTRDNQLPKRISSQLKALRNEAKLSQMEMAEKLQKTQSWVSLIEAGRIALTAELVASWCAILQVPEDEKQRLEATFARENELFVTWQEQTQNSQDLQLAIAEHERSAGLIRDFQVTFLNGLYQSPPYIEAIFHAVSAVEVSSDLSEFMQARLARQSVLLNQSVQVQSVIFESALMFTFGGAKVMVRQLEHLAHLIEKRLCNISLIPCTMPLPLVPYGNWVMFDDRLAVVELSPGQVTFASSAELAPLNYAFSTMWDRGLQQSDALEYVTALRHKYEQYDS